MNWWQRLWHRKQMDERLDKELDFHLHQRELDLIAQGHSPEEAHRLARIEFGAPEQVKDECREARGTLWLEDLLRDFRYAARTLARQPGFLAVALLTLALGTGATTVMFTVINGVLLKPLSYPDPHRLLVLHEQTDWSTHWGNQWGFSRLNFLDCNRNIHSLALAAWSFGGGTVSGPGKAEYADGREISASLFSVLGVSMAQGRAFLPEEDQPGATPVAIVSYSFWQRHYGNSPLEHAAPLLYDGRSFTVVGVTPPSFRLMDTELDILTPLGQDTRPIMQTRNFHGIRVVGRLSAGATLAQSQTELAMIARPLAQQFPDSNKGRTFVAEALHPNVGDVSSTLWLLLGAVSLVLLIACVNIASLMLARAISRERDFAMRMALGASRFRLIRQCLAESLALGLAGGMLGVMLAAMGFRPFITFWPGELPRAYEIQLDWHVLVFALAVSLFSSLLFGLAPALRAPVRNLEQALRAGARTLPGASRRMHSGFIVAEISLAVVLLVSAGVLGRTLLRLSSLQPGFDYHKVLVSRAALSPATLADPARTRAAWQDVLDRARRLPGVQAVAIVDTVPMRDGNNQIGYWTTPVQPSQDKMPLVLATSVTPDYQRVMGLSLLKGRFFTDADRIGNESVMVIDDVMAQKVFPGENPIGKHVWIDLGADPRRVVGVVGHVRHWGLASDDQSNVRSQLYYPFAQVPDDLVRRWSELMSVAVRTDIDPLNIVEPLGKEIRGAANDQVLYEVHTMEQLMGSTLALQRFLLLLFGIFAGLALLLACIGIYGVLAYLTNQRVPEIGVRMALGASARSVMWMMLRQSVVMILAGIALGTTASFAANQALKRLVPGVQSTEPLTLLLMLLVLLLAALLASYFPARRASRVDPMLALRQD